MKKLIAITLIAGIIITAYSFKSKASAEGENNIITMTSGMGAIVICYGNEKSETIELKRYGISVTGNMEVLAANSKVLCNQLNKFKVQGYELKGTAGGDAGTTYIFEKK
jgi:hypothetical protein